MAAQTPLVIVITGAGTGFGRLTAHALASAGHIVYGGLRGSRERQPKQYEEAQSFSKQNDVKLYPIQLDISSEEIVQQAVKTIISEQDHIDVVVHNAGHMNLGPTEAFTPEQFVELYEGTPYHARYIMSQPLTRI
jgi:NAD(P)-dependent dehydrogenase (short-subunit alcohol dehydrogenase family)